MAVSVLALDGCSSLGLNSPCSDCGSGGGPISRLSATISNGIGNVGNGCGLCGGRHKWFGRRGVATDGCEPGVGVPVDTGAPMGVIPAPGTVVPGSYVSYGNTVTANLTNLVTKGETNRVVITLVDDKCGNWAMPTANVKAPSLRYEPRGRCRDLLRSKAPEVLLSGPAGTGPGMRCSAISAIRTATASKCSTRITR